MANHKKVAELVKKAYVNSQEPFARWMWQNHVPIVAKKTEEFSMQFNADADIAVAGAWLHDFGDAFIHRHSEDHDEISEKEAVKILQQAEYSEAEIKSVMEEVIAPHSCKDGFLPKTLEGKAMATADALAHLTTDFYIQFTWKHYLKIKPMISLLNGLQKSLNATFTQKYFLMK